MFGPLQLPRKGRVLGWNWFRIEFGTILRVLKSNTSKTHNSVTPCYDKGSVYFSFMLSVVIIALKIGLDRPKITLILKPLHPD
jgi:hypothetical protein